MSYIIFDVLKTSVYISISIILIALLKDKILSKYTHKLNYILCILVTLRMLFISNIKVYIPFNIIKSKSNPNLANIYHITDENINTFNYIKIIFIIWIIGVIYVIFKNIYNQVVFYKKIRNITYEVSDYNIIQSLKEEKNKLNIKRNIKIFKIDGISSPALIGALNSKIILPNYNYDKNQLKWILRHELIHFKRKDNFLKFLLMMACAIHWFNPFTKILKIYFSEQCELSCDEKVLEKSNINEAKDYALVLLNTLRYRNTLKATIFYSQLNTNQINLIKRRVESMINFKKYKNGKVMGMLLGSICVLSIISFNVKSNNASVYADESLKTKVDKSTETNKELIKGEARNYNHFTEEEIKNNLKNADKSEMKDMMEFYPDRKFDELTQEEIDYALDFLFTGKCKKVNIGSDTTYSINFEHLYSNNK